MFSLYLLGLRVAQVTAPTPTSLPGAQRRSRAVYSRGAATCSPGLSCCRVLGLASTQPTRGARVEGNWGGGMYGVGRINGSPGCARVCRHPLPVEWAAMSWSQQRCPPPHCLQTGE